MNTTRFISRGVMAAVTLLLFAGLAMGQNLNLNGTGQTLGGNWTIKGNINTSGVSGTIMNTFSGTVSLAGTGTALTQTIANGATSAVQGLAFTNLNAGTQAGSAKAIAQGGDVTVNGPFVLNTGASAGAGQSYTVGVHNLNFVGTTSVTGGIFSAGSGSAVNYQYGGSSQTILSAIYGGTLGLSGASTKHVGTGGVQAATVSQAVSSGDLTVDNPFTITGNVTTTLQGVNVSSTLTNSSTSTSGIVQITSVTGTGITGTVTTTTTTGVGAIQFLQATALTNSGTITTDVGTITFAGDVTNSATKSLTVTGAGTMKFAGAVSNSGIFTLASNSTVEYNGTSAQTISAPSSGNYSKLTLTGNNTKTTYGNLSLNTLTINGTTALDMLTNNTLSALTWAINEAGTDSTAWASVKFGGSTGSVVPQGIVEYYATSGQTIAQGTYHELKLSGVATKTINDGTGVTTTGSLLVASGTTLNVGSVSAGTLTVDNTLDLKGSFANLFASSQTTILGDFNVNGSITNNGTITVGQ